MRRRWPIAVVIVVVGLATALAVLVAVPALTGTSELALPPAIQLPHGLHADPSAVPWSDVGPGWLAISWKPHARHKSVATDLILVSPSGTAFPLYELPGSAPALVEWSEDGTRILVETANSNPQSVLPGTYEVVDLRSGIVQGSFKPDSSDQTASLTTPHGDSVLIDNLNNADVQWLERYSVHGTPQLRFPDTFRQVGGWNGNWLQSPTGAQIVMGADHGLAILSRSGSIIATLPGHRASECIPEAFWGPGIIVASCTANENADTVDLFEFSRDWPTPRVLALDPNDGFGLYGAWRVDGRVLVQMQSCGPPVLGELHGHSVTMLQNPYESGIVLGTTSTSLDLLVPGGECLGGAVVVDRYRPSTNETVQVIGPTVLGGEATSAIGYSTPGQGSGPQGIP